MVNQAEIHSKALSKNAEERFAAAVALGSAFSQLPDKNAAWKDLIQLASTPSNYPDPDPDYLNALVARSEDHGGYCPDFSDIERAEIEEKEAELAADIRAAANYSLGRASIFRSTEAKDKETLKRELKDAVDFFEKSYKEAKYRWGGPPRYGPAQFCYPFYRTYFAIAFQEAKEDEVQRYIKDANDAVGGSKSKEELLKAVENLADALKESQRLKKRPIEKIVDELNAYRWYCEKAAEHMAAAEDKAPGAVKLMRVCNPLLEERIQDTTAEIQRSAKKICQVTRGSGTEYEVPGSQIYKAAGALSSGDLVSATVSSSIIVMQLKKFCQLLPEDEKDAICKVVEEIKHTPEFPKKLQNIALALSNLSPILQVLPHPLADVVILTVLPEEYSAVYNQLSDFSPLPDIGSRTNLYAWQFSNVYCSKYNNAYKVAVGITVRAGNYQSALAVREAIDLWRPRYIFFIGIAGGMAGLKKGDVIIADIVYGYEYGKINKKFEPRGNWAYRTDLALLTGATVYALRADWHKRIKTNPPEECKPDIIRGEIASGEKVVDNPSNEFFAQVLERYPKVNSIEMEGAGVGSAIEQAQSLSSQVGFMVIRGVSDLPRSKGKGKGSIERDDWKPYASDAAAAFTIGWIADGLPVPPSTR